MADEGTFANLDNAQLHYLKAQYLASVQLLDQTEAALETQLEQVAQARKQLAVSMTELDAQLAKSSAPKTPTKPVVTRPKRKPTRRTSVTR